MLNAFGQRSELTLDLLHFLVCFYESALPDDFTIVRSINASRADPTR